MKLNCNRSGLFTGLLKISEKHLEEARQNGLELIKPADKEFGKGYQNYKLYRYKSCKHLDYLQPTHVRRGNISCKICLELQYEKQAEALGLEIIGKGKSVYFRIYRNRKCGHITEVRTSSIGISNKNESFESPRHCVPCYDEKLKLDAVQQDMTYLGKAEYSSGVFRSYLFNKCGHVRDINASCVARGAVDCQECKVDRYKQEAISVGIIYNGESTVADCLKRNYLLECGHTKDIRIDHVRNGSWICHLCGNTHYTKPSKVYLLKIQDQGFEWLKLGYAKNIHVRQASYGLSNKAIVTELFSKDFLTGIDALHTEKSIHLKFKGFRLPSKFMEKYHKHNGHTECYDISIEKLIMEELNLKLKETNE